jgi:hypothetical protein
MDPASDQPGSGSNQTTAPPRQSAPAAPAQEVAASGCSGMATDFRWPGTTNPGKVPPGWDPDPMQGLSDASLEMYDCEAFRWLDEDVGPVRMLVEMHNSFTLPESCPTSGAPGPYGFYMLASWWLDNATLAERMRQEMGLPTVFGTLVHQDSSTPATEGAHWEWSSPGGESSFVDLVEAPSAPIPVTNTLDRRLYYFDEERVSHVHMALTGPRPSAGEGPATGHMAPEMLMSAFGSDYASTGLLRPGVGFEGPIVRYEDFQCG